MRCSSHEWKRLFDEPADSAQAILLRVLRNDRYVLCARCGAVGLRGLRSVRRVDDDYAEQLRAEAAQWRAWRLDE